MRIIPRQDCLEWCSSRRINISGITQIAFIGPPGVYIKIALPREFLRCAAFAVALCETFEHGGQESLLWMREWGMWSEDIDSLGVVYWKALRSDNRESLAEYQGHVFSNGEDQLIRALLLVPIMFQWDAHWIPGSGDAIVSIRHDGLAEIFLRGSNADRIAESLNRWGVSNDTNGPSPTTSWSKALYSRGVLAAW